MKKLMIAAAAAAMVGSGFAATKALEAQVYDFTATLKTTQCNKSGKTYDDVCFGKITYRESLTQKIYGKFWGCHCQVIANPGDGDDSTVTCNTTGNSGYGMPRDVEKSCIFWTNAKDADNGAFPYADWEWTLLQRVGKKCENIEGLFTLDLGDDSTTLDANLTGAGYGTVVLYGNCDGTDYIKSMSGNIVGEWNLANKTVNSGCAYCGSSIECVALPFCYDGTEDGTCEDLTDGSYAEFYVGDPITAPRSAVFGTFTIKYNAAEAKNVQNGKYIDELSLSAKKNKAAYALFEKIAKGSPVDEKAEALKDAYTTAKKAYDKANAKAEASAKTAEEAQKAAAEAVASEYLKDGITAATSTEGQKLAKEYTDAATAEDTAWKSFREITVMTDYKTAVDKYNTAVEAYNAGTGTKKAVSDKTEIMNAKADALTTTQKKTVDDYFDLVDKTKEAKAAVTEWETTGFAAAKAKAEQDVEDTAKVAEEAQKTADADAEAAEKAETALNNADIACRVANVDCE